jgi:hypothetical protein
MSRRNLPLKLLSLVKVQLVRVADNVPVLEGNT